MDGRTLWLSGPRILVRLSGIDTCDLPQWSFDPHAATAGPSPAPVPCGALAMAWLKRLVGDRRVTCRLDPGSTGTVHVGVCRVGSVDLGREMLRVGWARRAAGGASRPADRAVQSRAVDGRRGIWGTYVLDMEEWRKKAIDRTLGRRPAADWNLLSTRQREISPAFQDAHRQPRRRDR
ncbi:MAG: thermonuclease family protein [Alphaproteobacteria bacterium]|nr:thermonuclease family protein [Alphaproteobacteria bacterium]MBU1551266.1 thermonuclease family protein [Alphaproteobacteria bacterium]MBU2334799.1 thermonuclease family protein [Alphaproteobacteria bacterium]MBU2389302.1 thermonuclease family protein [Alphaproteobacteria bacterium]